jgi:tetrapyrrole methylase family protein/MazG family protein
VLDRHHHGRSGHDGAMERQDQQQGSASHNEPPSSDELPRIDIVGLGPAGADLVTAGTMALIDEIEHRFVRTQRHPAAPLARATSFDHHYESLDEFEAVYQRIVADLVAAATTYGRVLYAVPGSPRVAEHTVDLLAARTDVHVVVHGALSFLDLSWVALAIDPIDAGVRVIDGHRFAYEAAGLRGPLLVAQCHSQQVLSDIKLAVEEPGSIHAVVLQGLGTEDEKVYSIPWADLDREIDADHLTSIYIPELPTPVSDAFSRFDVMVKRLRHECPWDAEQTHGSLRRYLLEESYETLEALDRLSDLDDDDVETEQRFADLQEELGDLLYQIFFHSLLATEQGWFDVAQVAQGIYDKMHVRHPHVYGDTVTTLDELPANWEDAKRKEKGRSSVMDGIPAALPALLYAAKVQKKAIAIGQAPATPAEALAVNEAEVGELLFAVVALARSLDIDAESALRQHAAAYADQVRATEQ